jgi:Ca2+-binding RTX toxin-like protein
MRGGLGSDTYVVAQPADVVTENVNEGIDTVRSSLTYTLGANLENLALTGSSAINGTGNTLANVLTGNTGNNTLTGNAGNDTLDGGRSVRMTGVGERSGPAVTNAPGESLRPRRQGGTRPNAYACPLPQGHLR